MFSKLKKFMGVVGINVELEIPDELPLDATMLEGVVRVTAKQTQHITKVKVTMKQVHQEGSGADRTSKEYQIGEIMITDDPFDINEGEVKEFSFRLFFMRRKTADQRRSEQGGLMGAMGKLGKMMDNEKDTFWVNAMADVKGAALDPNDTEEIKFA